MDVLVQNIPQTDIVFLEELSRRMGWTFQTKENVLRKYISTRPKQTDLSDAEIMEVVNSVRYST
jgi:hypothetical protein